MQAVQLHIFPPDLPKVFPCTLGDASSPGALALGCPFAADEPPHPAPTNSPKLRANKAPPCRPIIIDSSVPSAGTPSAPGPLGRFVRGFVRHYRGASAAAASATPAGRSAACGEGAAGVCAGLCARRDRALALPLRRGVVVGGVELVRLACDGCGADLELPEDAHFVTCRFCDASLEVRRTDSTAFTRVREAVERVEQKTKKLSGEMRSLRAENRALSLQDDLHQLEREWDQHKADLMIRGKDGNLSEPTRFSAQVIGAVTVAIGAFVALAMPAAQSWLAGLAIAVVGVAVGLFQHSKAVRFERAQERYFDRRDELEAQIEKARRRAVRRG